MNALNQALQATKPFIAAMAMLAAFMTAWSFAADLLPFLRQVWSPKVPTLTTAAVTIALSLTAGR